MVPLWRFLMEHLQKGGISPGTPFKVAAAIAEFHLMEVRNALRRSRAKRKRSWISRVPPYVGHAEPGTTTWFGLQRGHPLSPFSTHSTMKPGELRTPTAMSRRPLMEKAEAGDLFAKAPDIHKLEILAAKLPR